MFGGAYFDLTTNRHVVVNERIWTFDFEKFEWAVLPSLKMPRPTYFHAAAMNEVSTRVSIFVRLIFLFSTVKSGLMVVLSLTHELPMRTPIAMKSVQQRCIPCVLEY